MNDKRREKTIDQLREEAKDNPLFLLELLERLFPDTLPTAYSSAREFTPLPAGLPERLLGRQEVIRTIRHTLTEE